MRTDGKIEQVKLLKQEKQILPIHDGIPKRIKPEDRRNNDYSFNRSRNNRLNPWVQEVTTKIVMTRGLLPLKTQRTTTITGDWSHKE